MKGFGFLRGLFNSQYMDQMYDDIARQQKAEDRRKRNYLNSISLALSGVKGKSTNCARKQAENDRNNYPAKYRGEFAHALTREARRKSLGMI